MRGKTWMENVAGVAGQMAATKIKTAPESIAKSAADIVDAIYAERTSRNAADGVGPLHSAEDIYGEGDDDES